MLAEKLPSTLNSIVQSPILWDLYKGDNFLDMVVVVGSSPIVITTLFSLRKHKQTTVNTAFTHATLLSKTHRIGCIGLALIYASLCKKSTFADIYCREIAELYTPT